MAKGKKQKQEEKAVSLSVRFLRVLTLEIPFCRTRGDNMGGGKSTDWKNKGNLVVNLSIGRFSGQRLNM